MITILRIDVSARKERSLTRELSRRFTFEEVNEAHSLFEAKQYTGKIVLTP